MPGLELPSAGRPTAGHSDSATLITGTVSDHSVTRRGRAPGRQERRVARCHAAALDSALKAAVRADAREAYGKVRRRRFTGRGRSGLPCQ
jgi:hypothetical protein